MKKFLPFIIGFIVYTAWCFFIPKIQISITPSAGKRIFWKKNKCNFSRNEIVAVKPPDNIPYFPKGNFLLLKHIMCLPDEYVIKIKNDFYCYSPHTKVDIYLGRALKKTHDGKPLTPWSPKGNEIIDFNGKKVVVFKIPSNYYFLNNPHPRSYDSRYLGLFKKEDIKYCLKPIF